MPDAIVADRLEVSNLCAWYGDSQALHGMNFAVEPGEIVTLLGRNGAGKSTTLKAIMGLIERRRGRIAFRGRDLVALSSDRIARAGIAYCPEERGIYGSLSVQENLMLPPTVAAGGWAVSEIYEMFPNLWERRKSGGAKLSGGEQQMLAIGRILRTGATLLLLDEPTEGLAPVIVEQIGAAIARLKARGMTVVLVEQKADFAAELADRHYVVEQGEVVDMFTRDTIAANTERLNRYLIV
jgi:branched-chain amino acid transport system ATP-binding protein